METSHHLETADGARLAYWRSRAGNASAGFVAFLHGAASNHTRWSELLAQSDLMRRWDTLRPDLRGNGRSMWRGRLDLETWSRDLAAILDAEACSRAVLVGHSLGAQIALDFADRFPDRTRGLVLIDPVFRSALTGKRKALLRYRHLLRIGIGGIRALNALGLGRRRFPGRDLRRLDLETREALRGTEAPEEIARRYGALGPILRHMPTANYLQQLAATVAPPPDLSRITCPVLVVVSRAASHADTAISRREIERFHRVETVTVDANHWPLTEKPEEVRRAIEEWIVRFTPSAPAPDDIPEPG